MKIGAHVSTAGGLQNAIDRAQDIGAETIQIFASSPRTWAFKPIAEEQVIGFRQKSEESNVSPTFLHAAYLVNVGGNLDIVKKSVDSLASHMNAAAQIGAVGVIFHGGSHKGVGFDAVLGQSVDALREVLARSPDEALLIVENCAGMGFQIGASFGEIARLVDAIDDPRVKVCLDTQHCYAAGYNLSDAEHINAVVEEFDREIGLSKLVAVHANDSKVDLDSGVDRHENIGEGHIGREGFGVIMGHPAFRDIPFILEVPGFAKEGPDKENVDILKGLRADLAIPQ